MDIRQTQNYANYMHAIGWTIESLPGCNIFIRHLPLISYFSVIKIQRPEKIDLPEIKKIVKKHRAIIAKLEPLSEVSLKRDSWPLLPTKTRILKTSLSLVDLPKDTRYEIRKGEGLKVEKSGDINLFYHMLEETMRLGHWSVPIKHEVTALWQAFQPSRSQIFLIKDLAACLLIWDGDTAHYMYAALTKQGRKTSAAYKLLWETLQFLKANGIHNLDLEGVYDERFKSHTKNWQGFTNFKRSWPGTEVEYPGSFSANLTTVESLLSVLS